MGTTLKLILMASLVLAALIAIWVFFVIPAQKKDYQRRMDLLHKKMERHQSANSDNTPSREDD